HAGLVGIVAKLAPRASLSKQIPILIELNLDFLEADTVAVRELSTSVQVLFLVNQRFDVFQHGLIGGVFRHDGSSGYAISSSESLLAVLYLLLFFPAAMTSF